VGPEGPGRLALSATVDEERTLRSEPEPATRSGSLRLPWAWLGALPFFAYALFFLLVPAGDVMIGAFRDDAGNWTMHNIDLLRQQQFQHAYENTLKLGIFTALTGGIFGALLCYFALHPSGPRAVRAVVTAFAAVSSQFGGVPLAFFWISTLGTVGVVTKFLHDAFGFDVYSHGFTIFGFWGVFLAYVYFQVPLMILVISPAIDGLKPEWREAAESLGASGRTYWLRVGLPVLAPSMLGAMVLLFGNAVAAQATAYALTGGGYNLVTNEITNVMNGNVLSDPHAGHALALGLVLIIVLAMLVYLPLQRRAARWMR
jgi:putative spermidine/putrescine transport system permease protein